MNYIVQRPFPVSLLIGLLENLIHKNIINKNPPIAGPIVKFNSPPFLSLK